MRQYLAVGVLLLVGHAGEAFAQSPAEIARIKSLVTYEQLRAQVPGLTRVDYERAVRAVAASTPSPTYLGRLSSNRYDPESVSNPYSTYGSPYSTRSVVNPYSSYGSPYSPRSWRNPYTTGGPGLYSQDGTYLGRLNSNRYDPNSVANPFGPYGSPYSPTSVTNPYGRYGSPYSPYSPWNPYTTEAPVIVDDDDQ